MKGARVVAFMQEVGDWPDILVAIGYQCIHISVCGIIVMGERVFPGAHIGSWHRHLAALAKYAPVRISSSRISDARTAVCSVIVKFDLSWIADRWVTIDIISLRQKI
jgi:hypothetical protein